MLDDNGCNNSRELRQRLGRIDLAHIADAHLHRGAVANGQAGVADLSVTQ
jgi:hypothetical protein